MTTLDLTRNKLREYKSVAAIKKEIYVILTSHPTTILINNL